MCHVEEALAKDVDSARFVPHLTLHEIEAWVLAAPDRVAVRFSKSALLQKIADLNRSSGGPEFVNEGYDTAPSRRLMELAPGYLKKVDGPEILNRAGLDAVLKECPHAAAWVESLRA